MITEELNDKLMYIASARTESQNEIVNRALSAYLKRWNYEEIQRNDGAGAEERTESN